MDEPRAIPASSRPVRRLWFILGWTAAFLLLPLCVLVARFAAENVGWITFGYLIYGTVLQGGAGLLLGLSLLLLPHAHPAGPGGSAVHPGRGLQILLAATWALGFLGALTLPDAGDMPDSATALAPLAATLGMDRAQDVSWVLGLGLLAASLLCGLAAVVVVALRRTRAARARA